MGCQCNCLNKKPEGPEENFNNIIIEDKNVNDNNQVLNKINFDTEADNKANVSNLSNEVDINTLRNGKENLTKSRNNNIRKIISYDSTLLSKIQEQTDSIFEYFEELRASPEDYQKDAEDHQLSELLQKVQNSQNSCSTMILNPFLNVLLTSYANTYSEDDTNDNLIEALENDEKLKEYNQKLFLVKADIYQPKEVIWKLIGDNKDIAYETFFMNKIEYLLISCTQIPNNPDFKCYFLFLTKKENKK